jgi:hypothetical protein
MKFCDSDACPSCPLGGNAPECLRYKAKFCTALARTTSARSVRAALDKLSVLLMEEAAALEKETAALARTAQPARHALAIPSMAPA